MPPILKHKHYDQPSVFDPANLLREARRQKAIPSGSVPEVCVLDPDGDLFRHLKTSGARFNPFWACYHTELYELMVDGGPVGVLGCAVGASFAVLVAEELFTSGCQFLISVTSAGQIVPLKSPPYFVLIDHALRDEGTSYHYLSPEPYSVISPKAMNVAKHLPPIIDLVVGGAWTTDAPFRETKEAIAFAQAENLLAVEMEAAALYALSKAKNYPIACFAHVTNQMAQNGNDFEKGEAHGNMALISLIVGMSRAWRANLKESNPLDLNEFNRDE